jgi:hypothetical protein
VDEEQNFEEAREAHPPDMMETSEAVNHEGEPWNPRLHVLTHAAVLNQIEEVSAVNETFEELQSRFGLHPHAAIHALSSVLMEEIASMQANEEIYDADRHEQALDELTNPLADRHHTAVVNRKHGDPPDHPKENFGGTE